MTQENSYKQISYFKVFMGTGLGKHFEIEVDLKKNIMNYDEIDINNLFDSIQKNRNVLLNKERKEKIYKLLVKYEFLEWCKKFKGVFIIDANSWQIDFTLDGKRFQAIPDSAPPENWDKFLNELKGYFQNTNEEGDEIPEIKINGSITLPFAMNEDEAFKIVMEALESKNLSFEGSIKKES